MLPAALYKCASELSISSLFEALNATNKHPYVLSAEDLKECLETRDYLANQNRNIYRLFQDYGSNNNICYSEERCAAVMKEMVFDHYKGTQATDCNVLRRLSQWIPLFTQTAKKSSTGSSPNRLCQSCVAAKLSEAECQQEEIWRHLQAKFEAPSVCIMCPISPSVFERVFTAVVLAFN